MKENNKTSEQNQLNGDQPQKKGWMDLLKNYIKNGQRPTKLKQEEETTKLFIEILDDDKKKKDPGNKNIPRFFL